MTAPTPELAGAGDAPAVRALVRAAYAHYVPRTGWEPPPMNADYAAAIADGAVQVVRDGAGGAITAVAVIRGADDHLLLENLAVLPSDQGRGLGGRVLAWVEQRAAERGYAEVRLFTHETMVENIAFYLRHGYAITRTADEDPYRRVHFAKHSRPQG